ncbi:MAG TPA: hypothetical protein VN934_09410 [Candidatus Tumulicola sp.]|nr:hypothetical protein [Candidatus Tumulicola sp.]
MRSSTHRLIAISASAFVLAISPPALGASTDQALSINKSFIEWAFGFKLDSATLQSIRQGIVVDTASDPAGSQSSLDNMSTVMAWVAKHSPSESRLLRSVVEPNLVAQWQTDTGSSAFASKAVIAAWRKHNRIIAEGRPPLRRSVVNAYIAMYEFTAKQAGKPVPAAIADHAGFARRVAGQYAAAPADSQMKFNQIQPLWLSFQALWAQSTPAQQNALRAAFRAKPVAVRPPPTAAPQSGLSGNVSAEEKYKEHLFVQNEGQSMMSNWSNPF